MSWRGVASGRAFSAAFLQAAAVIAVGSCDAQVLRLLPDEDAAVRPNATDAGHPSRSSCTRDRQCESPLPRCDVAAGRCVECISAADCASSEQCDPATRYCTTPCTDDRDCRSSGSELAYCDSHRGFCVQCFSNDDCTGSRRTLLCESGRGQCVECLTAADCDKGESCDPDYYYCAAR